MHPNYRNSFVRPGAAALLQWPILSNRTGSPACAYRDAIESDLMR
jgi:hypothetical protein